MSRLKLYRHYVKNNFFNIKDKIKAYLKSYKKRRR